MRGKEWCLDSQQGKQRAKEKGILTSKYREQLTINLKLYIHQNYLFRNTENIRTFLVEQKPRVCHQQIFTIGTSKECASVKKKIIAKEKSEMQKE